MKRLSFLLAMLAVAGCASGRRAFPDPSAVLPDRPLTGTYWQLADFRTSAYAIDLREAPPEFADGKYGAYLQFFSEPLTESVVGYKWVPPSAVVRQLDAGLVCSGSTGEWHMMGEGVMRIALGDREGVGCFGYAKAVSDALDSAVSPPDAAGWRYDIQGDRLRIHFDSDDPNAVMTFIASPRPPGLR